MFWQEENSADSFDVGDAVIDLAFDMTCSALPVDHMADLSRAICARLPWIETEAGAGIHPLHVAESGNGWMRPEDPDAMLYPSRRTKLVLRIPGVRREAARALCGQTLAVRGQPLTLGNANVRPLVRITSLFARQVVLQSKEAGQEETAFLAGCVAELKGLSIVPRKLLCGRAVTMHSQDVVIRARSLMVADLSLEESLHLQQNGLGGLRHMGCGLFIGHKDIAPIGQKQSVK